MEEGAGSEVASKKIKLDLENCINFIQLCEETRTEDDCIDFCRRYGILPMSSPCPGCGGIVERVTKTKEKKSSRARYSFDCTKKTCQRLGKQRVSLKKNTFFEGSKLSTRKALFLIYNFIRRSDMDTARIETSGPYFDNKVTSAETVVDIYSKCRLVCSQSLRERDKDKKIGGVNFQVEVDVTQLFGNHHNQEDYRQYRIGLEDDKIQWVMGGICRETDECFLVALPDRRQETLTSIVIERLAPGTIIIADCFPTGDKLMENGFIYSKVTSRHNSDGNSTSTPSAAISPTPCRKMKNKIDSTWWAVKRFLPRSGTQKHLLGAHLDEFLWRRGKSKASLFYEFLKEIARMYPGPGAGSKNTVLESSNTSKNSTEEQPPAQDEHG